MKARRSRAPSCASLWPVQGLLVRIAGQGSNGFRVVDIWETEEAFRRFGDHLMPVFDKLAIQVEPEVYPAYAFVAG